MPMADGGWQMSWHERRARSDAPYLNICGTFARGPILSQLMPVEINLKTADDADKRR
jgi:hypothetical protein